MGRRYHRRAMVSGCLNAILAASCPSLCEAVMVSRRNDRQSCSLSHNLLGFLCCRGLRLQSRESAGNKDKCWPGSFPGAPYEIKLDIGQLVYALSDNDVMIRSEAPRTPKSCRRTHECCASEGTKGSQRGTTDKSIRWPLLQAAERGRQPFSFNLGVDVVATGLALVTCRAKPAEVGSCWTPSLENLGLAHRRTPTRTKIFDASGAGASCCKHAWLNIC